MDNFFKNLFSARREVVTQPAEPESNTAKATEGDGSFEENIRYVTSEEYALRIATFHRCLELRANTMAQLTPQYQRLNKDGGNFVESDFGLFGRLNYLLQVEPNPLTTSFDFWRQIEIETVVHGNAFVIIRRDETGWPSSFWLASYGTYNQADNTFILTYNDIGGMRNVMLDAKDVLHFPNTFKSGGSILGISTLQFAREMLTLSSTLDKTALETAAKGGRMKLFISEGQAGGVAPISAGRFDPAQVDAYASAVQAKLYSNDVVALQNLDKIQNISMSAQDMQLFDQRQFGVAEICRMMSTPRTLAMDGSNSSYRTPEADRLDFLMNCIQPKRRLLEDELNRKLLSPSDFGRRRIHLCELPLMMFDKKGQAEIDERNIRNGTMTVNEVRKQYDMPAVENGDIVYISTNLAELGSDKLRGGTGTGAPAEMPTITETDETIEGNEE